MSNPIQEAIELTGWTEDVVAYLYDEFTEQGDDDEDFFEYLADQIGTGAFVIAASGGMGIEACLEAYAQGGAALLDPDFDVDDAVDAVNLADLPEEDTELFDEK
jgi:hypothetical protein